MMKNIYVLLIFFAYKSAMATTEVASPEGERAYSQGMDLLEAGKPNKAIPYLVKAQELNSASNGANWGLASAYLNAGISLKAEVFFLKYYSSNPSDPYALEKLIQVYQEKSQLKEVESYVVKLRAIWKTDSAYSSKDGFIRDLFIDTDRSFVGYEYFLPESPNKIYYRFLPLKSGNKDELISLGSYDSTSSISRELEGKPKDWRLYHLDGYCGNSHTTYGFFDSKPSYQSIREIVIDIYESGQLPCSKI